MCPGHNDSTTCPGHDVPRARRAPGTTCPVQSPELAVLHGLGMPTHCPRLMQVGAGQPPGGRWRLDSCTHQSCWCWHCSMALLPDRWDGRLTADLMVHGSPVTSLFLFSGRSTSTIARSVGPQVARRSGHGSMAWVSSGIFCMGAETHQKAAKREGPARSLQYWAATQCRRYYHLNLPAWQQRGLLCETQSGLL